jgi:hypothetical protein
MEFATVGYYRDRQQARVPIHRRSIETVFARRPEVLRVEFREDAIILTDPEGPGFAALQEDA